MPKKRKLERRFVMEPVSSSQISAIGYDEDFQVLRIRFKNNGAEYEYENVPVEIHEQLMAASSHGEYFSGVIKTGPYPYVRVK